MDIRSLYFLFHYQNGVAMLTFCPVIVKTGSEWLVNNGAAFEMQGLTILIATKCVVAEMQPTFLVVT